MIETRSTRRGRISFNTAPVMAPAQTRAIGVKRAFHCLIELAPVALFGLRASPRSFFSQLDINYLPMWALWRCRRRACVVQAQRQIHRVFAGHLDRRWPDNASSPPDHRAIRRRVGWTN